MPARPKRGTEYVAYVTAVVAVRARTDTIEQARDYAIHEVQEALKRIDANVYIPKVAMMEAEVDTETKEHLAQQHAPWLSEGFEGKKGGNA